MKKKAVIIVAALIGVLILAGAVYYGVNRYKLKTRTYSAYDITASQKLSGSTVDGYLVVEEGILRYSRDGASVIDGELKEVWNVSFDFNEPIADACKKYAVLADKGAKTLYIIAGDVDYTKVTTEYAIEKVVIAAQGVCAVWMDGVEQDYVTLYSAKGEKLVDMNTLTSASGFPVDMAISEDGTKLITDYVDFDDDVMTSLVTFYNFGDVGEKNYVDGLVGQNKYAAALYADVTFLNNDTCVAFGTDGFVLYSMEEIPEVICQIKVSDTIKRVAYSDQYIGLLVESGKQGEGYVSRIYNLKGNIVEERQLMSVYSHYQINADCLLVYDDLQFNVYRIGGKTKIETPLDKKADAIAPVDDQNHFIILGEQYAEHIKLIGEIE